MQYLDPTKTGLVVFDMLECYRPKIEAAGAVEPIRRLIRSCRDFGVPIFYARADHRPDGSDYSRVVTDTDSEFRPYDDTYQPAHRFAHPPESMGVLEEFAPEPMDYDLPKHRWNAFFQTPLDLSLRSRGVDTVLLAGGSTHVGIASTAFGARDMDYNVVIVRDGQTGFERQREFFLDHVFPRMARVRTVSEIQAMWRDS
ncbi:cysteine hydrolase family protein [Egicoccus sp. AB-alg6-2]|uniref:cysteine hydrolase family protein n=1 Tax=Egicoccus sp. AB-alg6-2 TaxID=3242692 RepID=UPI00359D2633